MNLSSSNATSRILQDSDGARSLMAWMKKIAGIRIYRNPIMKRTCIRVDSGFSGSLPLSKKSARRPKARARKAMPEKETENEIMRTGEA